MYFSAKQYYSHLCSPNAYPETLYLRQQLNVPNSTPITLNMAKRGLRNVKKAIAARKGSITANNTPGVSPNCFISLGKWIRPWHIVPELREFRAPEGDFGIGVEVEMGFRNTAAAQIVANYIKNWKYVTLDFEGGQYPIEATFPPMIYSKISKRSQVYRYLKFLQENRDLVAPNQGAVGTHVNVSCSGLDMVAQQRLNSVNDILMYRLTGSDKTKYFGRTPYGYGRYRGRPDNQYIEYKLFNSQLDPRRLLQYINIAVALTKLVVDQTTPVTADSVRAALEAGYNKHIPA
jgi:hypothetical protein